MAQGAVLGFLGCEPLFERVDALLVILVAFLQLGLDGDQALFEFRDLFGAAFLGAHEVRALRQQGAYEPILHEPSEVRQQSGADEFVFSAASPRPGFGMCGLV